ncbi:MAG TPA: HAMP domain-containing sensor histidine kinase [Candidatus Ozemobacteraceae bacterium]|nr:HAMP domain-containing sensor histidine kinase [Candidatus Ozemobacteraceae bacterium]
MKRFQGMGIFTRIVIWFLITSGAILVVLSGLLMHVHARAENDRLAMWSDFMDEQGRLLAGLHEKLPDQTVDELENLKLIPLFLYDSTGRLLFAPKRLRHLSRAEEEKERDDVIHKLGALVPQVKTASEAYQSFTILGESYLARRLDAGVSEPTRTTREVGRRRPDGAVQPDPRTVFLRLKGKSLLDLRGLLLDERIGWWVAFIGLIIGFLCFWLTRSFVKPIVEFQRTSRTIAEGRFHARLPAELTGRFDELGALAADFNSMASRIEATIRDQQQLLWDVSHELRTPLTRVGLALELIRQAQPEHRERLIGKMERNVVKLNGLLQQILDFARLGGNADMVVEKKPVLLGRLIETVVDDVGIEADAHEQTITVVPWPRDVVVEGAEEPLRRAVENVLLNAIRHTPAKTGIRVSLNADDASRMAVITVSDSGRGVPADELPKLFTPFFRGSETADEPPGGFGLGLAIAQRAFQAHGGRITAKNGEGGGLMVEMHIGFQGYETAKHK